MIKVILSTGIELEVYTPPVWRVHDMAAKMHPDPRPPTVTSETVTGGEITMELVDDPEYLAAKDAQNLAYSQTVNELNTLLALRKLEVPEDFSMDSITDELCYIDPEWHPREGKIGRKLDYIEYDLLAAPVDVLLIQQIVNDLSTVDQEEIAATAASFQS